MLCFCSLPKRGLHLKERMCPYNSEKGSALRGKNLLHGSKVLPFREDPFSEGGSKRDTYCRIFLLNPV